MVLSDGDILERLISFDSLGLGISLERTLRLVKEGKIPDGLRQALKNGKIIIEPFPSKEELEERLGPASLDLEMGNTIRVLGRQTQPDKVAVDFSQPQTPEVKDEEKILAQDEKFILQSGKFVQAATRQLIMVPVDLMGRVSGRSRFGRYGLTATIDVPKIDPGFIGKVVLEILNVGSRPFVLYPGLLICQIIFEVLSSPSQRPYFERGGGFLGQEAP